DLDGPYDFEIVRRTRIHVSHLYRAIAVASPDFFAGGHQDAIRSLTVWGWGRSVARTRETGNAAHEQVALGIDDVDAEVGSVGKVKSLGLGMHRGNVRDQAGM